MAPASPPLPPPLAMLRRGWNERTKSEAKKKKKEGVGFWVSMLFIFQCNCKPQCQTILFHYVCWRLRVGGGISHYMVDMLIH
jgi:hypothetical protein